MDSIGTQAYAKLLENGVQAIEEVNRLRSAGYSRDDIYVISHDQVREGRIVDAADTNEVSLSEEGLFGAIANLFRSRGMRSVSKLLHWVLAVQKQASTRKSLI